ncbi:hypothetical protein NL676_015357 [Syzygium grande]|nr:hypothetical protein NL676_015357 [Syzygium grande]
MVKLRAAPIGHTARRAANPPPRIPAVIHRNDPRATFETAPPLPPPPPPPPTHRHLRSTKAGVRAGYRTRVCRTFFKLPDDELNGLCARGRARESGRFDLTRDSASLQQGGFPFLVTC